MSGPIVRTGATPEFWKNWDSVFGKKTKGAAVPRDSAGKSESSKKKAAGKKPASTAKKVKPKKAAPKSTKKK